MKRKHHHAKQHLVHLIDVDLTTQDIQGLSDNLTSLLLQATITDTHQTNWSE